jgi:hypothetical protein
MIRWLSRAALAWLALGVLQALAGALLLPGAPAPRGAGWLLLAPSNALVVMVAMGLASRMAARGWRRILALFAILWGVHANLLIEAAFFPLGIPRTVLPPLVLDSFLVTLAFVAIVDRLTGVSLAANETWPAGRGVGSWLARVVACDLAYSIVYLGAGMLAWPFLRDFYASKALPGLGAILGVQAFRGLVFTGLLALLTARVAGRRATVAILAGLTFSILGGIAPLILPNPYLPEAVRRVHLVEVGISNLLFGWGAVLVLARRLASGC